MSEITAKKIEEMIYIIRGQKVMLDSDLAELYEVETRYLNKSVKRNINRFPSDFMFQLNEAEYKSLMFQNGTSKIGRGGRRKLPYMFTEPGVAMLASVLKSEKAINVNISIIRTFIRLRHLLAAEESLSDKISSLEKGTDRLFRIVFERLDNIETKIPLRPKVR
jgi:phage regulator Rha-like protein